MSEPADRNRASSTLIVIGLYLVLALEATSTRRARLVGALCASLLAAYVVILAVLIFYPQGMFGAVGRKRV